MLITSKLILSLFLLIFFSFSLSAAQICNSTTTDDWPDDRYIVHSTNGTVLDKTTKLIWKQCSEGQTGSTCTGSASTFTWKEALEEASNSTFATHTNWRLPNIKELASLAKINCQLPSINKIIFPNTPPNKSFWSSSPSADYSWVLTGIKIETKSRGAKEMVRLVRFRY